MDLDIGPATADDHDQIVELVRSQIGEEDALEAEIALRTADHGASGGWKVARQGDRVAACLLLIEARARVGAVTVPAATVELVATDPAVTGRGIMRSLLEHTHEVCDSSGLVLQWIEGIPNFYRRFGYEYAAPTPDEVACDALELPTGWTARKAGPEDLAELVAIQERTSDRADVSFAHPPLEWGWILESPVYETYIAARGEERAAARRYLWDGVPHVFDVAADGPDGVMAAVAAAADGSTATVLSRHGVEEWIRRLGRPSSRSYSRYVRIADPIALLRALTPEFERRLARAGWTGSRRTMVGFYTSSVEIELSEGSIVGWEPAGRLPAPISAGGLGVPSDLFAHLVVGPWGARALRTQYADVLYGSEDRLWEVLFPPMSQDVQTWVYP